MAVMMTPREKWTDERLDDLDRRVEQGFSDLKAEMKAGFDRMEARFEKVDARFEKMDARFETMDDRFHTLNLAFLGGAAVVIATLVGGILF